MASVIGKIRNHAVKLTDARVRLVSEVLTGVRVVKYNGWSSSFLARIQGLRTKEMAQIGKAGYLRSASSTIKVRKLLNSDSLISACGIVPLFFGGLRFKEMAQACETGYVRSAS